MAERRTGTAGWIIAVILLLLLVGGGVYSYLHYWPQISKTNTLNQELADLKTANDALVTEKTETAKKISELETTKQSMTDANTSLADQIIKIVGDRDSIKQSEVYFARVYNETLNENGKINKDNEALRKEISRLKTENGRLAADNRRLQAQYDQLLAEKKAAEAARQAAEDKVADLARDIDAAKKDKEAAEMKAAKAAQDLVKIEADKMEAQGKVVNLNAQITDNLLNKKALQNQLDTAKEALEVAEKRLANSDKLVAKAPTEDTVKENLALKAEIRFLYATILVATSTEKNLSDESRRKATNLMVRLTYQSDADLRLKAAAKVMEEMPLDGAESVDQLHTRWGAWKKTQE